MDNNTTVQLWEEEIVIPTYATGEPDKNPMFFEKRVYQGSSGAVYPYPIIEKIHDEKKDVKHRVVFLENEYIKLMIMPQFGGRIQMAYDKFAQRHFIYYNDVIKPALVGLCGPWISGGIEFNWPQHHRPSTYEPIDYSFEANDDGSKTVWVNEIERMNHTKGMAGFTLYPGKAYVEVKARLFNRTPLASTFLWWANPAVYVNDEYQSIFPPDVHAVYDHGRRDVSEFPIAKGTYYKVNYAPGTDISRYKNIPVPTSYMAVNSAYDFIGGYEHDNKAGMLHIANHHISPGKKQWTWGNGDFGQAWDRNLTDNNGPYIELMTGVYTDNQPDFSWIMPHEHRSFEQYFLPYRELGQVKSANKDLALGFEVGDEKVSLKLYGSHRQTINLLIQKAGKVVHEEQVAIAPEKIFEWSGTTTTDAREQDFTITITNTRKEELLRYQLKEEKKEIPEPAKAPEAPERMLTNESLHLTGLHLEQYRHATFDPTAYYREALKRDSGDVRNNNAMGLWYLRRGKFEYAEPFFKRAIQTLTQYNANPYDGEAYYNLGLTLSYLGRFDEAYDAFYKATWNLAWQSNSFLGIAQINVRRGQWDKAIAHLRLCLQGNGGNSKATWLLIHALRKSGKNVEKEISAALAQDAFNLTLYFERFKATGDHTALATAVEISRGDVQNIITYVIEFATAGLYEEAAEWLNIFADAKSFTPTEMFWYYRGWISEKMREQSLAKQYFFSAQNATPDLYFPNRLEDIAVLTAAISDNEGAYRAHYLLGCLWYDKRQYNDAIAHWEISSALRPDVPASLRNLGIACFNKKGESLQAERYFEQAYALDNDDARILMELDQLKKRINRPVDARLRFLEQHLAQVQKRDDLFLERVAMYNFLGRHQQAYDLLMGRVFHPWEGGEGKVSAQYKISLVQMARECLRENNAQKAIELLVSATTYPHNLGEGKLYGTPENEIYYLMGEANTQLGDQEKGLLCYQKASEGNAQPTVAIFYNDPQPDSIFFKGLATAKLGHQDQAEEIYNRLIVYGQEHLHDNVQLDFFAVSLPDLLIFDDDLNKRNQVHCKYMMALGCIGIEDYESARTLFNQVLSADAAHMGAKLHAKMIPAAVASEIPS
jgi:tetratricopeptide (TPR) repeat protein